eukprot:6313610-Amphidinium_carterae.1
MFEVKSAPSSGAGAAPPAAAAPTSNTATPPAHEAQTCAIASILPILCGCMTLLRSLLENAFVACVAGGKHSHSSSSANAWGNAWHGGIALSF